MNSRSRWFGQAVLLCSAPLQATEPTWETDLDIALRRAALENKPILVEIWTEWCPPCQLLKKHVFTAPALQSSFSKVVLLSLCVEKADHSKTKAAEFADRLKVGGGYPHMLILDSSGKKLRERFGGPSSVDFVADAVEKIKRFVDGNADSHGA